MKSSRSKADKIWRLRGGKAFGAAARFLPFVMVSLGLIVILSRFSPAPATAGLITVQQVGTVTLAVTPVSVSAAPGDVFVLSLQVEAGSQALDGVQAEVSFPPALLEVVDADPTAAGVQISGGSTLPTKLVNTANNTLGTILYAAGVVLNPDASVTGTFGLAEVQFRAKAAGSASVQYGGVTKVTFVGESAPLNFRSGTVSIQASGGANQPGPGAGSGATPTPFPSPTPVPSTSPTPTARPVAPDLVGPVGGTALPALGPSLQWRQPEGTTQFQVRVTPYNNDGPGINLIISDLQLVTKSQYQIEAPDMAAATNFVMLPGMTYRWEVRVSGAPRTLSEDAPEWSAWSQGDFRTPPPSSGAITVAFPQNGDPVANLTPQLTWANNDPHIFYYEVQVSKDPSFNNDPATAVAPLYWNLVHGGVTNPANTYSVPQASPLEPGAQYYWRVRPRVQGDGAPVAWSTTWSFRTP